MADVNPLIQGFSNCYAVGLANKKPAGVSFSGLRSGFTVCFCRCFSACNRASIENWVLVIVRYVTNAVNFPCIIFTTKKYLKMDASPVTRPFNNLDCFTV